MNDLEFKDFLLQTRVRKRMTGEGGVRDRGTEYINRTRSLLRRPRNTKKEPETYLASHTSTSNLNNDKRVSKSPRSVDRLSY